MLSYQHAYHAGGPADVHKHIVLAELLARLTAKARGLSYVETHAGRGLYDLAGARGGQDRRGGGGHRPHDAGPRDALRPRPRRRPHGAGRERLSRLAPRRPRAAPAAGPR